MSGLYSTYFITPLPNLTTSTVISRAKWFSYPVAWKWPLLFMVSWPLLYLWPLKLDPQFTQVICFHLKLELLLWDYNLPHTVLINCYFLRLSCLTNWAVLKLSTSLNVLPLIDCLSDLSIYLFSNFLTMVFLCYSASHKCVFSSLLLMFLLLQCPYYCKLLVSIVLSLSSLPPPLQSPKASPSHHLLSCPPRAFSFLLEYSIPQSLPFSQQEGYDTFPKRKLSF